MNSRHRLAAVKLDSPSPGMPKALFALFLAFSGLPLDWGKLSPLTAWFADKSEEPLRGSALRRPQTRFSDRPEL